MSYDFEATKSPETIFTLMHVKSAPHIKFVYYTNTQHDQNTQATPNKYAVDDNAIYSFIVFCKLPPCQILNVFWYSLHNASSIKWKFPAYDEFLVF